MNFHIKTYGCQMNERESEALACLLTDMGYNETLDEEKADVIILNTCSVREQAERKAIGKIAFMKKYKRSNPDLVIGAIGCMAQNRGAELLEKLPHLDFVLGTGKLHLLPETIEKVRQERRRFAELAQSDAVLNAMGTHFHRDGERPHNAFIAITRGCNRFCAYCIVPYVRGREISRAQDDVVAEAGMLAASGVREIMLLGQNVASYGWGGNVNPPPDGVSPFADLLERLAAIDGIKRIRFTSPYPTFFNAKLIRTMAGQPKICRNVHLPLQSGSAAVLKAMNRQYTPERYLEIVAGLKAAMPEITFSTDVIVGFPGETEADFLATRDVMDQVGFDQAYIFKYSPRPGTRSAERDDDVPQHVKEERNQILLADLEKRCIASNRSYVGKTVEVMFDGPSPRNPDRYSGRTSTAKTVVFAPQEGLTPGDLVEVTVERAGRVTLFGPGLIAPDEELLP